LQEVEDEDNHVGLGLRSLKQEEIISAKEGKEAK
jgi:hypothetical protein